MTIKITESLWILPTVVVVLPDSLTAMSNEIERKFGGGGVQKGVLPSDFHSHAL